MAPITSALSIFMLSPNVFRNDKAIFIRSPYVRT